MQETSANEVCESSFSFFLREKGVRLGLVVEEEDQALGTCVCGDLSTTTHPLLKCVCPRSVSFFGKRVCA
jgi:hypothetical protein